jgi:hypothetical protein
MQTDEKQACAACGAANRLEASNCWQCFARFSVPVPPVPVPGTAADVAPVRPGFPPPAMPTTAPPGVPEPSTGGPGGIVVAAVGLLALIGGFLLVQRVLDGGGLELPDTLAGSPRMHGGSAETVEAQMQEAMAAFDVEIDTGLYGSGAAPDFVVVAVEGSSLDSTDAMFDEFVTGLTAAGAIVSGEGTNADLDGAEHRCVGVQAQGAQMGACMWHADDHAGFVLQLDGTNESAETLLATIWPDLAD